MAECLGDKQVDAELDLFVLHDLTVKQHRLVGINLALRLGIIVQRRMSENNSCAASSGRDKTVPALLAVDVSLLRLKTLTRRDGQPLLVRSRRQQGCGHAVSSRHNGGLFCSEYPVVFRQNNGTMGGTVVYSTVRADGAAWHVSHVYEQLQQRMWREWRVPSAFD